MTALEGFPLPSTSRHDENGNHVPPHIPEWRKTAGTDRVLRGSEVERDQRQKAQFEAHLEKHRRRGEPAITVAGIAATEKLGEECSECGNEIPHVPGGGLANRHHQESCSLYDADKK